MTVDQPFYVVAFVGLRRAIPAAARGILERCALSLVEFEDAYDALGSLTRRLQVDAIVLDGAGSNEAEEDEGGVDDLLALAAAPPWHDSPIPVIVLTSAHTPLYVRQLGGVGRVHTIGRARLRYRHVSRLIARLCDARSARSVVPRPADLSVRP